MAVDKEQYKQIASRWGAWRHVILGTVALVVLVGGVGVWSAFASIAGAVVAMGQLKVESNRQVVQHLDGGVVKEILVKEGDVVEAGDVMVRLDDKLMVGELAIAEGQLYEIMARRGRLIAERDGLPAPVFNDELRNAAQKNPEISSLLAGQERLYNARATSMIGQKEQLRERQSQIREEISGAGAQSVALTSQLELVGRELTDLRSLLAKGLAQASRVLALERENARLLGQAGEIKSNIARLKGQISEIEMQLLGLVSTQREEAITELRDFEYRENELREQRNSLVETLDRLDVKAPRPGRVLGMTIYALRSVVRPAEPILYIVPSDVELVVEARIETINIDQIYPGQVARLRFSAFSARTTPEVPGKVVKVSPDTFTDEATGMSYYSAELKFDIAELDAFSELELIAGMPVETYIQTGERSPYSYFTKPLTDYFNKALREE